MSKKNKKQSSVYEPVSENIYFDGSSYRVRMTINGLLQSKSFQSERKAKQYRNQLKATR